jgi:hypothetical protein
LAGFLVRLCVKLSDGFANVFFRGRKKGNEMRRNPFSDTKISDTSNDALLDALRGQPTPAENAEPEEDNGNGDDEDEGEKMKKKWYQNRKIKMVGFSLLGFIWVVITIWGVASFMSSDAGVSLPPPPPTAPSMQPSASPTNEAIPPPAVAPPAATKPRTIDLSACDWRQIEVTPGTDNREFSVPTECIKYEY